MSHHSLAVVTREADITVQRHEAGADSVYDVTRALALVAQVRSTIPELEGQRRAALFELTALLGRTPAQAPQDLQTCVTPPHLVALIPVGDGSALIKRRPDVSQAERRLAAATAQIGVATAICIPRSDWWGCTAVLPRNYRNSTRTSAVRGASVLRSAGLFPTWPDHAHACVKPRPRKPRHWRRSMPWCSQR